MNALSSYTYSTVHATPEPDASYVSFEVSGDPHSVSLLVAKVVRLFKPKSFTLSLLADIGHYHEQCRHVAKLLQADFSTSWPLSKMEVGDMHASVCSFRANDPATRFVSSPIRPRTDGIALQVGERFGALAVEEGVSGVQLADKLSSHSRRARAGGATLMVDLSSVEREMRQVYHVVGPQVQLRYLVKVNAARGILAVLNEMGACFEASDELDVSALESVGVCRERIVLVSTVVCEEMVGRVGAVAVFGGGATVEMAARCGVGVEIRVVDGIVSQLDEVLKEVALWGARGRFEEGLPRSGRYACPSGGRGDWGARAVRGRGGGGAEGGAGARGGRGRAGGGDGGRARGAGGGERAAGGGGTQAARGRARAVLPERRRVRRAQRGDGEGRDGARERGRRGRRRARGAVRAHVRQPGRGVARLRARDGRGRRGGGQRRGALWRRDALQRLWRRRAHVLPCAQVTAAGQR
ncbi:Adenosylmethionine decarboxylase [Gracilaria domingensis]|nr:Adenosylmethionine decarboxylase [Gracilaria domingensis]